PRSSRFSRSSSLIRSRSAVVGPGRLPRSRSACRTQLRSVSPEQPIFAAIDWMAAHCDAYSRSCSNTSRTARSRTSGEYFFACLMTPISQELESPANPGRFGGASSSPSEKELSGRTEAPRHRSRLDDCVQRLGPRCEAVVGVWQRQTNGPQLAPAPHELGALRECE